MCRIVVQSRMPQKHHAETRHGYRRHERTQTCHAITQYTFRHDGDQIIGLQDLGKDQKARCGKHDSTSVADLRQ